MDKTTRRSSVRTIIYTILGSSILLACSQNESPQELSHNDDLVLTCQGNCSEVIKQVKDLGGSINHEYKSFNAVSVTVPAKYAKQVANINGISSIRKDESIARPAPVKQFRANSTNLSYQNLNSNGTSVVNPNNYLFNNVMLGANQLHEVGITGNGVIVAIIDSGTANNPDIVPALSGSVIGGESFINLPNEPSATSTANDFHGTAVGSMIAAHIGVVLDNDDGLLQAVATHAPDSVIPVDETTSMIPMLGSAPEASLYAMKVFPANSEFTDSSTILAAMDRALTLKQNFNAGMPSEPVSGDGTEENPYVYDSLNIQVVNLSLGGLAMVAGLELEDILAREMLKQGINVVTSSGNDGFAALTMGSPGTSVATVTVGATMTPQHERILREVVYGPGMGDLFRPNDIIQTAYFSSRGPTADGRYGVNVVANGYASFVQASDGGIMLISGTSFSSPTVAGTAALLWQANPDASAAQVREAIIQSADASILPRDSRIDQGMGFVNVPQAHAILATTAGQIPDLPKIRKNKLAKVEDNLEAIQMNTIELEDESFQTMVNLQPGETVHLLLETSLESESIHFEFSEVSFELPLEQQNQLFGDAILFNVADGPLTINNFALDARVLEDEQFQLQNPQTGLVRVALLGDWTNAGAVNAKITIREKQRDLEDPYKTGKLKDDEIDAFILDVGSETTQLNFELAWKGDWGHYPAHDIDLILIDPNGAPLFDAATLDAPERISIDSPVPGDWTVIVTGYMLHGFKDKYKLYITDQNNTPLDD